MMDTTQTATVIRARIAALEAQLDRVRRKGGDGRVEDQLRHDIERWRQALDYVK